MFEWLNGWFNYNPSKSKKVKEVTEPKKVMSKANLMKLTKEQLEQMGRENGIELDRRKTKDKLVDRLHKKLQSN